MKIKPKQTMPRMRQAKMTLIELVIVLALLAGLAGLALTAVGDMGRRGRYDETTARMRLIREAIVGDGTEAGRFIRDLGRLPIFYGAPEEGEELSELWRDAGELGYGEFTGSVTWPESTPPPEVPTEITLRGGWNGPYLFVDDPAEARIFDGFGNPFQIDRDGEDDRMLTITSLGADGLAGGETWAEQDRTLDLDALIPKTSLRVEVKARDDTNTWQTVEIDPGGTEPHQVGALHVGLFYPEISGSERNVGTDFEQDSPNHTFTGLMPISVRVFAYSESGGDTLVSGAEPQWVDLRPGANSIILYLREAPE